MVLKLAFSKSVGWLIAASGFVLVGQSANSFKSVAIPSDPLEMVTGKIDVASSPASREAAIQLLTRARDGYGVRSAGVGYDLKVSFTTNSHGQTDYDGAWEMEEIYDPQQGLRWTAKASAGYSTTQIASKQLHYGAGAGNVIPLRLQEARAALFDPIPSGNLDGDLIRTATSTFRGKPLACVLLSRPGNAAVTPGRRWEETEECIDPQSGLLQIHSQVPGRYYAYDYSSARQFSGHLLPSRVTVTEAGEVVSEIQVQSLTSRAASDPTLFVPSADMTAAGPAIRMMGAQKLSRFAGPGPFPIGATVQPVCVFGLVTPTGQLVEAHSLQPSDPNSQAAVDAARQINFAGPAMVGTQPQQHFVFVIEKFLSAQ